MATGANHRRIVETAEAKRKEYMDFLVARLESEKWSELRKFLDKHGGEIIDSKNEEHKRLQKLSRQFVGLLRRKAKSLGGRCREGTYDFVYSVPPEEGDFVDLLGSWDNESKLHKFIVKNFGDKKKDASEGIYLDEKALTKIFKHFLNSNYPLNISPFRIAMYVVRGGGVVFYRAC